MKKTKILCTLGPASAAVDTIRQMIEAGMNAARINTSHGDFAQYHQLIERVRTLENLPIVMDTQGPKIRLRMRQNREIHAGEVITVGFDSNQDNYLDADVFELLNVGDRALIDDGILEAFVVTRGNRTLDFRFSNAGYLTSGRSVNFPKKALPLEALSPKDKQSLQFALEHSVDFIALSFTRGKEDIQTCRSFLPGGSVKIIAKIENQQGIDHFAEILDLADGVMIARGDMGVELEPEEIPLIQKQLIRRCNEAGKPVITATQMLQSMVHNPRPTRAETSDVANAILDGSDAVMLSGETANGEFPVQAVQMMSRIAQHTEPFVNTPEKIIPGLGVERAVCDSIEQICIEAGIDKIVTITRRGYTAKLISRLRLQAEILALTFSEPIHRELHLFYGVQPILCPDTGKRFTPAEAGLFLHQRGLIQSHELILFASAEYNPTELKTNAIHIISMSDLMEFCHKNAIEVD